MRVITGKAKGCKLKAPKGLSTRPTSDRVKESVFNILGEIPNNSKVLDLYAGSGGIGIEFLSRGAQVSYFIDNSIESIKIIKQNLKSTKLLQQAHVYKNDVHRAIRILSKRNIKFQFVFLDPPYEKNLAITTVEEICRNNILAEMGKIIIEHETKALLPDEIFNLEKYDQRKYGGTTVSFYKFKEV